MIFFSVMVLFGSQIQHLWVAPAGDFAFDVLATITFAFFVLDMTIRIIAEPHYFQVGSSSTIGGGAYSGSGGGGGESSKDCLVLGSFMFWCDLVSTGVILYDISYINKGHYGVVDVDIQLNESGIPVRSGLVCFAASGVDM
jgi:hypothetical protein